MKKAFLKYIIFIPALFLWACANIVNPSGGPKDVKPPVVLKTLPANFSSEFKGHTVKINFDEFVQIKDAASQVVVSPFMKESPELKVKGRSIVIDFKDTLKPNTTYSVSFGKAIADNNEGNILLNYSYVFSTGMLIDTLTLKGVVKNAFSLKPENGIFVFLYNRTYDSVPYKETPFYISKTDEAGVFTFTNVKDGKYKLFALKDGNGNFLFDQSSEIIAFPDSLITPEPLDTAKKDSLRKNKSYDLFSFEETPASQRLLKVFAAKYGKVVLIFRKPVENLVISPLTKKIPFSWNIQELNKTKDTITLWLKNPDLDSLVFKVSDNNVILDTAQLGLIKKNSQLNRGKGEEIKNVGIKAIVRDNGTFDFYKPFIIESSVPVSEYNFKKIILNENKDTVNATFVFTDSIKRHILINCKWKEKTTYTLFILPGAFKDIFNTSNDTLKIKFTTTSSSDYGNIKLAIKTPKIKFNYIVQLVTDADAVIQEKFLEQNEPIKFNNIAPGNYRFKLIFDKNNNKKWDTGNYLKKIQPEKIIYYPSSIIVKPNWDLDIDWEIVQ